MPEGAEHVWQWYWGLRGAVGGHERPLSHEHIVSWLTITGDLVTRRECDMLFSMDLAFRKGMAEEIKINTERAASRAEKPKAGKKWQTM